MSDAHSTEKFKKRLVFFFNVIIFQLPIFYRKIHLRNNEVKVIGMIRERNESLLLKDTLDHLATFVDGIVVFDDASTDESVDIAKKHPAVLEVVVNKKWSKNRRVWQETTHRRKLYTAAKKYKPEWFFYSDADERFEGDIKQDLLNLPAAIEAVSISLYDAYMTKDDNSAFSNGKNLQNFRKYFGPERRDIIMAWRNLDKINFISPDAREPQNINRKNVKNLFYCQHYGKSLSVQHWEETCDYYVTYFPKYSEKWSKRRGKGVHEVSDFGEELLTWSQVLKNDQARREAL